MLLNPRVQHFSMKAGNEKKIKLSLAGEAILWDQALKEKSHCKRSRNTVA